MNRPKRVMVLAVIIVAIVTVGSISILYLNSQSLFWGKTENLSFGTFFGSSEPYATLVYVAQDQHFFAQNGINLTITDYSSATNGLNSALNGKVNLAISSEYAFIATNVLKQGNLNIISTIDKAQSVSIVCRKDSGIENIADLDGKKIGLTFQIAPQFYLARFLELNNIKLSDVSQIDIPTTQYVSAIVNGTVDAVVVSDSSIFQIQQQLPNDTVVWSVQGSQLLNLVVSGRKDWIAQHPSLVTHFLKSLAQAEDYAVNHPAGAQAIVQKQVNLTNSVMAQKWFSHQFSLSLERSLVATMEDETRWMMTNHLTNQTAIPDFLDYIYAQGLYSVKPESVNIIH